MSNNPATRRIGRNDDAPRYHIYDEHNEHHESEDDLCDAFDRAEAMHERLKVTTYVYDTFDNAEVYKIYSG